MIEAQTLAWTEARAHSRERTYRRVLALCLIVDALLGLFALFFPLTLADLLYQPDPFPAAWPRVWGVSLMGTSLLCLSGLSRPGFYRWPNWGGIAVRILAGIVFLLQGPGFYLLAAWEGASGIALLILYARFVMAADGARP